MDKGAEAGRGEGSVIAVEDSARAVIPPLCLLLFGAGL